MHCSAASFSFYTSLTQCLHQVRLAIYLRPGTGITLSVGVGLDGRSAPHFGDALVCSLIASLPLTKPTEEIVRGFSETDCIPVKPVAGSPQEQVETALRARCHGRVRSSNASEPAQLRHPARCGGQRGIPEGLTKGQRLNDYPSKLPISQSLPGSGRVAIFHTFGEKIQVSVYATKSVRTRRREKPPPRSPPPPVVGFSIRLS